MLDRVRLRPRLFDELPRELDVRLQRRLCFREEFVPVRRLRRAECVDHLRRQRDRAVGKRAHFGGRVLRHEQALLDRVDNALELMEQARPFLEDGAVAVLDFLQDLEHVEREQPRLLPDDHRGEERVRRTLDQDLRVPEIEPLHANPRARSERVFHEVLDDGEHAGENVLVDLLTELAAVVSDKPSVGVDQEDVLDEVRCLGLDSDLLRVTDLVAVLVEEPLVRDPNRDRDGARGFRLDADPDGDDLAHADLGDRRDLFRLDVARELDLDVPRREFPAVLDLEGVLVPLAGLEARGREAQLEVRVSVLDEILDLDADRDFGLFDQDVRHRHVARAERGFRLAQGFLRVPDFRTEAFRVRDHRGDAVDPRLVFLEEVRPAGVLEGRAGVREAVLEAIDIAADDRLPGLFQIPSGGFRRDALPFGLRDEVLEAFDFGHRPFHNLLPLCVQESLLEVALQPVYGFQVVRGGRIPGMRPELLELLFVKAERHALVDEAGGGNDDRIEGGPSRGGGPLLPQLFVPPPNPEVTPLEYPPCPRAGD